jgi:DNA-binding beta-propeller fold protein YncE
VLVSNRVSGTITFVDYQTLEVGDSIKVPGGPDCMEITADGKQAWVTQRWLQKVGVVDLEQKKIIAQIPVGRSPHGIYFRSHAARK